LQLADLAACFVNDRKAHDADQPSSGQHTT
jgi:hypothetical protein